MFEAIKTKLKQLIFIPEVAYHFSMRALYCIGFCLFIFTLTKLILLNYNTVEGYAIVTDAKQVSEYVKYSRDNYRIDLKYNCDGKIIENSIRVNVNGMKLVEAGKRSKIICNKRFKNFVKIKGYSDLDNIVYLIFTVVALIAIYLTLKEKQKILKQRDENED